MVLVVHVSQERTHNPFRIRPAVGERDRQIEQIPPGFPLVQRAQLGAEQFIQLVAVNLPAGTDPATIDKEFFWDLVLGAATRLGVDLLQARKH